MMPFVPLTRANLVCLSHANGSLLCTDHQHALVLRTPPPLAKILSGASTLRIHPPSRSRYYALRTGA